MIFDWLFGKRAHARQLNRDAKSILRYAREGYGPDRQGQAAVATRRAIQDAHDRMEQGNEERKTVVRALKDYHRGARRTRNDINLTAFTLAIIYIEAEGLEDAAVNAKQGIEDFLADWKHLEDDEHDVVF